MIQKSTLMFGQISTSGVIYQRYLHISTTFFKMSPTILAAVLFGPIASVTNSKKPIAFTTIPSRQGLVEKCHMQIYLPLWICQTALHPIMLFSFKCKPLFVPSQDILLWISTDSAWNFLFGKVFVYSLRQHSTDSRLQINTIPTTVSSSQNLVNHWIWDDLFDL